MFSVDFEYIEGGTKRVEFTESENDRYHYVVWVDGTPLGEVLVSSVKDITDNLAKYVAGQEVTEVW